MRPLRALVLRVALAFPAAATAAPISFVASEGSLAVSVWVNGVSVANGSGSLDAGQLVFDPDTGVVSDLSLGASDLGAPVPALPGAYDTLGLSVSISAGSGFGSTGDSTNPYDITLGPLSVAFVLSITDATAPVSVPPLSFAGGLAIDFLDATISYAGGATTLTFHGMRLAEFVHGGLSVVVRGDVEVVARPVPEPTFAALALVGVAGLSALGRRRR
jgi:hypothetical protein